MDKRILVFADWDGLDRPLKLGDLHARGDGDRDMFSFEFDANALTNGQVVQLNLDPRIGLYEGGQYPSNGMARFGVFADASPDRWGRLLMDRRLERDLRAGRGTAMNVLHESDYLLGVHDRYRIGALRFKMEEKGPFLDDRDDAAAPPWVQLRTLEAASLALERDESNSAAAGDEWLRMLIAPGGSLGGARPKASVVDPDGRLWIAKFPSVGDDHDVGGWEAVVHALAKACGLKVPRSESKRFANSAHTFLVERFDRTPSGKRLHFASAMTLTNRVDGDDASTGVSYLDIAQVIIRNAVRVGEDLKELWSRILFNVLVSNTDDHLRNHGFILVPGFGWRLSEAYDLNPVKGSTGLKLNVSEKDNALDIDLVRSVAVHFRIAAVDADATIRKFKAIVKQWPKVASKLEIPRQEMNRYSAAFALAELP